MLVLSRKRNQTIVIGEGIKIEVLKIKGNTVRLGIQAPASVKVLRGELTRLADKSEQPEVVEAAVDQEMERLDLLPNPFAATTQIASQAV